MNVRSLFLLPLLLCLTACLGMGSRKPAPVINYGQSSGAGSAGVHNVNAGDTLYSISNNYRLPMRDIAVLNRLQAPFKLYEGSRLRLPPPREYTVKLGDTLYGVSRLFGVNSSEIARLNDINSPYIISRGQVLRLPFLTRKTNKTSKPSPLIAQISRQKSPATGVSNVPAPPPENPVRLAVIRAGVPVPQGKPLYSSAGKGSGTTHVSKVSTKIPKRASSKFRRPVNGKIISRYGVKKSGLHNDGINIKAPRGSPVRAAENGVVVYAGNALKGSGNLVLVRHENRWMTAYAHMDSIIARKGQVLKRGQILGKVGSTGSVSTSQLHFEVRRGTSAMNPSKYME